MAATPGMVTARVYFGQLKSVMTELDNITFNVSAGYLLAHPQQCALTVVFDGVSGTQAAVYAQGLATGWSAADGTPDQRVPLGRLVGRWRVHACRRGEHPDE
jgi:hypothetical protein